MGTATYCIGINEAGQPIYETHFLQVTNLSKKGGKR